MLSARNVLLPVGGQWVITVVTRDANGYPSSVETPAGTVTDPAAAVTALVFTAVEAGVWQAVHVVAVPGRYTAHVTTTSAAVDFAAYANGPTTGTGMPDTDDVADYLRENAASWTTAELADALNAEAAAQRARCRIRAVYPDDLRQALLRRVQRNLAMRGLPLAVLQGDADAGGNILPGNDPEVRRWEAPHRKMTVG